MAIRCTSCNLPGDAILFGIPMLGLLVLNFFRLDHMLGLKRRSVRRRVSGHPLSQVGDGGQFLCVEPDGRLTRLGVRGDGGYGTVVEAIVPVRRVTAQWAAKDCWE